MKRIIALLGISILFMNSSMAQNTIDTEEINNSSASENVLELKQDEKIVSKDLKAKASEFIEEIKTDHLQFIRCHRRSASDHTLNIRAGIVRQRCFQHIPVTLIQILWLDN